MDRSDRVAEVIRYHQATKHHFFRYARSPGYLDWANQPDPFRRYDGAPLIPLPLLKPDEAPVSPLYEDLYRSGAVATVPVSVRSISRFFEYALAISAWKQAGGTRWALRSNPSSGNLHPTEGYLAIEKVSGLAPSPGLYHYAPKEHALELRSEFSGERFKQLMQAFPPHAFLVGLTSVHWREAWKYGERAFRYCQHDVGHAIGALRVAAAALGWNLLLLDGVADDTLAELLGVGRVEDFEGAEREHPGCIAVVWPANLEPGAAAEDKARLPLFLDPVAVQDRRGQRWYGKANRLSRDNPVSWEIIDAVAEATWKPSMEQVFVECLLSPSSVAAGRATGPRGEEEVRGHSPSAGQVIRQRRSALAFDGKTSIPAVGFFTMLTRVMPHSERPARQRPMPWDAVPWLPTVHLALFVHRVDGLQPGLYFLLRDPAQAGVLRHAMYTRFDWVSPPGCPEDLPLFLLQEGDARHLAAQVSCGQDIAGDGAFSSGMIALFEPSLRRYGPWLYRRLFWETGLIGQVLYLEAEAAGVRATGIGCFFDDPVHEVFGFKDLSFQSLYHFTTGGHVDDPRLTTLPPYEFVKG